MLKKIVSVTLAAMMAMSLGVTTFAASAERKIEELCGSPISEDGVQYNAGDSVAPGQTIYYLIPADAAKYLNDANIAKLTTRKIKNSSLIKSIKLVEKKLVTGTGTYTVPSGQTAPNPTTNTIPQANRNTYLAIELNNTTGTDEYKVELDVTFTAKKAIAGFNYGTGTTPFLAAPMNVNEKLTLKTSFYVANNSDGGNTTVSVGAKGIVIKPVKNDTNEITFESSGDTLATVTFKANSNPDKFYAQMTTKWTSALLTKFRNTDAVVRVFTPVTLDVSTRATVMLNNPFDESVSTKNVYIYSVDASGKLTDVTSSFTYDADEDAFIAKTRSLGTWVISDKKVSVQ